MEGQALKRVLTAGNVMDWKETTQLRNGLCEFKRYSFIRYIKTEHNGLFYVQVCGILLNIN